MSLNFDAVQSVLDNKVTPLLVAHGGGVRLCSISNEGEVRVSFKGACTTCPSMRDTMDELIEGALRTEFPDEDFRLIAVQETAEELLAQARQILKERRKEKENQSNKRD